MASTPCTWTLANARTECSDGVLQTFDLRDRGVAVVLNYGIALTQVVPNDATGIVKVAAAVPVIAVIDTLCIGCSFYDCVQRFP